MICDLHTHTNHSDGSVSTDELVERGYVASVREAFAGLLEESCGLYKPYGRLKLCDAIDFLRGIASLGCC